MTTSHGLTASGCKPIAGITIAASRSIPFGTHIVIEGHDYIVQDRLSRKYDNRIDIFMSSEHEAKQFGIKKLSVKR